MTRLDNLTLKDLNSSLTTTLSRLQSQPTARTIILIDGLDFLLAVQPTATATQAQNLLLDLQSKVHNIVITFAADSALLHNTDASATPLEFEHSTFARTLAHSSNWMFQLRPLETGQSKEVSGSMRVSKGGAWEEKDDQERKLDGGEWLYHFRGDGVVRVWGRGEA